MTHGFCTYAVSSPTQSYKGTKQKSASFEVIIGTSISPTSIFAGLWPQVTSFLFFSLYFGFLVCHMMAQIYNTNIWEAEAGRSPYVLGQLGYMVNLISKKGGEAGHGGARL